MEYLYIITHFGSMIVFGYAVGYFMASKISKIRKEFLHFKIDIVKYIDEGDRLSNKKERDGSTKRREL